MPLLSTLIFLPLVGALAILLLPSERLARWIALGATIATAVMAAPLITDFDKTSTALQFAESHEWIPSWGVDYGLGVDGISVPFILLASLLSILCVSVSWKAIQTRVRGFFAALLVAETAMIGLFAASNLFLFFVFWELMVVPLFLLIGIWGGPGRVYASVKFLLFTLAGSVLMLVGMIALLDIFGTLDFRALAAGHEQLSGTQQAWLFGAFLAAFAVKVPMFPVHTWLPDAHTEAPTAGSVILAGILLKMGGYGFLRLSLPVLPDAVELFTGPMLIALVQTDIKRLIAYSSVSHMGFVTLGIFTLTTKGVEGGILQMINHGILSGALFLCVGMIYERTHTREIADYGGVARVAPIYCTLLALFCLATTGMPGLNSFVGEVLIIAGAFETNGWLGALAIWGVVLGTIYLVWLFYRVVMGELNPGLKGMKLELSAREVATLIPLAVGAIVLGLYPECVLSYLRAPVAELLSSGVGP